MENNYEDIKEIIFNTKRSWWISIILLIALSTLIGLVCYIELDLKTLKNGLSSDLDTLVIFFYGIVSLFCGIFYTFVFYYICISHKLYKKTINIQSLKYINLFFWMSYFLPTIFCFVIHYMLDRRVSGKTSNKKSKLHQANNKIPYKLIIKSFEQYQDKNGNWWYKDDQNNYYKSNANGEWEKVN